LIEVFASNFKILFTYPFMSEYTNYCLARCESPQGLYKLFKQKQIPSIIVDPPVLKRMKIAENEIDWVAFGIRAELLSDPRLFEIRLPVFHIQDQGNLCEWTLTLLSLKEQPSFAFLMDPTPEEIEEHRNAQPLNTLNQELISRFFGQPWLKLEPALRYWRLKQFMKLVRAPFLPMFDMGLTCPSDLPDAAIQEANRQLGEHFPGTPQIAPPPPQPSVGEPTLASEID
jgi:hypothetical protein